jgi:hypothetical protein
MKEKVVDILKNEYGYSDHAALVTADDLLNILPQLQPALQEWVDTRAITNVEVEGISVNQLMAREYTFPSALISMHWLLTEPEVAKAELSYEIRK